MVGEQFRTILGSASLTSPEATPDLVLARYEDLVPARVARPFPYVLLVWIKPRQRAPQRWESAHLVVGRAADEAHREGVHAGGGVEADRGFGCRVKGFVGHACILARDHILAQQCTSRGQALHCDPVASKDVQIPKRCWCSLTTSTLTQEKEELHKWASAKTKSSTHCLLFRVRARRGRWISRLWSHTEQVARPRKPRTSRQS